MDAEKTMRTRQNIRAAQLPPLGYRKFDDPFGGAKILWQKKVKDGCDTKYFINLYEYDFSSFDSVPYDTSFELNLSFETEDFGTVQIAVLLDPSDHILSVERKAQGLFQALRAKNYE